MAGTKHATRVLAAALIFRAFSAYAMAQESPVESAPPSIHLGEWLLARPRAKIQLDFREFRPAFDDKPSGFQGRRLRFGLDGTLFRDLGYSVRVETRKAEPEFRDLFLRYQRFGSFQVQGGRFKIPFGLDQLTDSGELDFVHRSRIGSTVAPGRDVGAMVQGDLLKGKIDYSAGLFQHDGKNSEIEDFAATDDTRPGGKRTMAARLTTKPADLLSIWSPIRNLRLGAAVTRSDLAPGLSSLPGLTASNQIFFPRMFASGTRLRRGLELSGTLATLSIQGEFMDTREERLGQGLHGEDLPALRTQGWYLSAVQPVIGHLDSTSRAGFLRSILPSKQLGLLEVAARYETIRFGSVSSGGASASRSARAANAVSNDERAWTLGINWHASRYLKLQLNGVRETLRDPLRTPIEGETRYWTLVARLQLYF